jgi:type I restriction enzyme S subunit
MNNCLPKGWASTSVGEVIEDLRSGFASGEKSVEGGVAHLRMNNIGLNGELVLDLVRTVPEKLAKPDYDLRRGDVLLCTTNSGKLVGKCTYFDIPGRFTFSNHLSRLRPNAVVIDGRFLLWNLWLIWRSGGFDDKCKNWVNQSTIPKEALIETEVVLPPLAEQQRIMAKTDKLLSKVNGCRTRLSTIPFILKRFRQSVVAAACSGRLTVDWREEQPKKAVVELLSGESDALPSSWKPVCVGDVIENLKYGTSQKCSHTRLGVPVLRIPNVLNGVIDQTDLKYAQLPPKELDQLRLRVGDILLIRSNGSVSLVGRTALVREQEIGLAYAGYLIRLRPIRDQIESEFLNLALSSFDVRLQIELEARSTSGVNNINSEEVRALRFSLPPLAEQKEIVRRVSELLALADTIETRYKVTQRGVNHLSHSILAKAFQGELVPTEAELAEAEGRSFQSAEELLRLINSNPQRTGGGKEHSNSQIKRPRRSKGRKHSGLPQ